jgi:AcrR family transcriptional regulator
MKRAPRPYAQRARAESAAATARAILDAARELFFTSGYDSVTLQTVADRAGVALKTVLRRFGSKDALLLACAQHGAEEHVAREAPPGDVPAIAHVLATRYEATAAAMRTVWPLEERSPQIAEAVGYARRAHQAWLGVAFAPHLPRRGAVRERRLAMLFAATELYVWDSLRRHLGLDVLRAEEVLRETLLALVARWRAQDGRR